MVGHVKYLIKVLGGYPEPRDIPQNRNGASEKDSIVLKIESPRNAGKANPPTAAPAEIPALSHSDDQLKFDLNL